MNSVTARRMEGSISGTKGSKVLLLGAFPSTDEASYKRRTRSDKLSGRVLLLVSSKLRWQALNSWFIDGWPFDRLY